MNKISHCIICVSKIHLVSHSVHKTESPSTFLTKSNSESKMDNVENFSLY